MRLAERDGRDKTMRIRGHCVTAGFVNPSLVMPVFVAAMTKIITAKLSRFFILSLLGSQPTFGRLRKPACPPIHADCRQKKYSGKTLAC
jgi:hypothetical protein